MKENTAGEKRCHVHEIGDIRLEAGVEGQALHTRMMHAFHRIRKVNVGALTEISQTEYFALQIIGAFQEEYPEKEGIYVSELAEKLRIASSQASRMLRSLEERDLIRRTVDKKNRRNTYVSLTDKGVRVQESTTRRLKTYIKRVIEKMGEEKLEMMVKLCNEMADVMEAEVEAQVKDCRENAQADRQERTDKN